MRRTWSRRIAYSPRRTDRRRRSVTADAGRYHSCKFCERARCWSPNGQSVGLGCRKNREKFENPRRDVRPQVQTPERVLEPMVVHLG